VRILHNTSSRARRSAVAVDLAPDGITYGFNRGRRSVSVFCRFRAVFRDPVMNVSDIGLYPRQSIALVEPVAVVFVVSAPQQSEFVEPEHDREHHPERPGHIAYSHAVWALDHDGRRFDHLFRHRSTLTRSRVCTGEHAAYEIVAHVVKRRHEQINRAV
jgi:hypothetical protein